MRRCSLSIELCNAASGGVLRYGTLGVTVSGGYGMVRYRVRHGIPYRDSMCVCVIGGGPPRSLAETVYSTMESLGVPAERRSLGVYQQDAAPPVFGAHTRAGGERREYRG